MTIEHKIDIYLGVVTNIIKQPTTSLKIPGDPHEEDMLSGHDAQEHMIIAAVPGVYEHLRALPEKNNLEEPKIGDRVIIYVWDPVYNSYNTYRKLQENDIVGFRAHGKMLDITHDRIKVGVFDETIEYSEDERPETPISHVEMDKYGNILVHASNDTTVYIEGNTTINVLGDCTLKVNGKLTTNATIWEGNQGTVAPTPGKGPFCAIPVCPYTGAPHVGYISSGGQSGAEPCPKHD
ncbi:MAG: hypothetical protein J6I84_04915 [Bacilli bacterium]|nr:hypothetical protein [Bacilli bacterium]